MTAFLALAGVTKRWAHEVTVGPVTLDIARGEFVALLGPSGSGKTTLLRLLAGFETPDAGSVQVEGEEVTRLPPARRRFGMVFQHYALFPHLDVGANVAFGLAKTGAERRVAAALALVDLAGFERRRDDFAFAVESFSMRDFEIPQALNLAKSHHSAGRMADAEAIYRQILARDARVAGGSVCRRRVSPPRPPRPARR